MASGVPTIKQVNWWSLIPQILFGLLLMLAWLQFYPKYGILYGALTYLLLSYGLRRLIPRDHRAGMTKVRAENFAAAITNFEKSYQFFTEHTWLDTFRFITMLSPSAISFREMALVNIAFCYGQLGDVEKAEAYYQKTLKLFPESGIAKTGLRFLTSARGQKEN